MKELTTGQIQIAASNYRLARQHMTNAVEELRYTKSEIAFPNAANYSNTNFHLKKCCYH